MNYCTTCKSLCAQPGTCNCFAHRVAPFVVPPSPIQPTPPLPYIGDPPPMMPSTGWHPMLGTNPSTLAGLPTVVYSPVVT